MSATRSLSGFSTQVHAAWNFRSAHVDGLTALPLAAIRFLPQLDENGEAAGGRPFTFPVVVQAQPGASSAPLSALTVQVSFDDGGTWSPAEVRRRHDQWEVTVEHPRGPGSVSLRATAADASGNAAELTIIDAYRLR